MCEHTRTIGVIFLHPGCNMSCSFCVTENGFSAMRFAQGLALLDRLGRAGFDNVVLGGGEPYTWPHDVVRFAGAAKRRGFVTQVGTNGIALPPHFEHAPEIDRYVLPLDASDAGTHNRLRRYHGDHHGLILDRLACLAPAGKSVTVSTVVNAENIGGLPSLGALLAKYVLDGGRLHAWHLYRFIPSGREGGRNAARLYVPEEEYLAACDGVKGEELGFTIYRRQDMRHSRTVDFFWYEGERLVAGSEVWGERDAESLLSAP
jgi:MoaA/NifB/PqqE/SkfB family radical SAM enzyme